MPESSPENRPDIQSEESKEIDTRKLSFEKLKEAYELSSVTFKQVDNGFVCANNRDEILIRQRGGKFKIYRFPAGEGRQELHRSMIEESPDSILRAGSSDKEKLMNAIKNLLEKTGNRIIE